MEPNESHHQPHPGFSYFTTTTTTTPTTASSGLASHSPTNGLLPPNTNTDGSGGAGAHMVFPHSVGPSTAAVSTAPVDPARKKRGRPRKYGTPEQALAAKRTAAAASGSASREKRETGPSSASYGGGVKKGPGVNIGNAGHGFTPHVISISPGEDVGSKLMAFLQQSRREMCILSASGSISNAYLCQPATSGGGISFEGQFEIISLSGSYVSTGGGRAGGLSVCLCSTDGQIIGGGVGGPLRAAGPVQVIVGTFLLEKGDDASGSKLPSPIGGTSMSGIGFRSSAESSVRNPIRGNDDHQTIGANPFMANPWGMPMASSRPTDRTGGPDARINAGYEMTGRAGRGTHHSPGNGDYEQVRD